MYDLLERLEKWPNVSGAKPLRGNLAGRYRLRTELGLTQVQLAKLAGICQETLSRLESGKHKPNVRTVERIETALKRKRAKR